MDKKIGEIWKEKNGTRTIWKVQFDKGILTFGTKKQAQKISQAFYGK